MIWPSLLIDALVNGASFEIPANSLLSLLGFWSEKRTLGRLDGNRGKRRHGNDAHKETRASES